MDDLSGRAAVVTGAASGIGLALAERAAGEGMRVVMADVEEASLDQAAAKVRAGTGADVLAVVTDVSDLASVEALAQRATDTFGPIGLLCNNAGVAAGGFLTETPMGAWEWVLGVNLWGVIHGLHVFLPEMVRGGEGHVVNTASMAGLLAAPGMGAYNASKYAVVGISETLYRELEVSGSGVGVSVLCPGFVRTRIAEAERNWPSRLGAPPEAGASGAIVEQMLKDRVLAGMDPAEVAGRVFEAVKEPRFWVLTHAEEFADQMRSRSEAALTGDRPKPFLPG